jgi:hypothetical protein
MPGRGAGERLVIDPNNNNVLYLGTLPLELRLNMSPDALKAPAPETASGARQTPA